MKNQVGLIGLLVLGLFIAGCGGGSSPDHTPPAGMGSIMVNNNTGDDILVYIDGIATSSHASYADITPYDLTPGSHRVTLTESRGWRNYSGFVDVLQGRLTYLDVSDDLKNIYAYDVATFYN